MFQHLKKETDPDEKDMLPSDVKSLQTILTELRAVVPKGATYTKTYLETNWWRFYPLQWTILRHREAIQAEAMRTNTKIPRGCRLYSICPSFHLRPMHISIPPTALQTCIIPNMKWGNASPSTAEHKEPLDKETQLLQDWLRVFQLAPLRPFQQKFGEKPIQINQAKRHEFHHLITTDGLTASVHLHKRSPVNTPCKRRKVERKEESKHRSVAFPSKRNVQAKPEPKAMSPEEHLKDREMYGLDPGRKDLYSAWPPWQGFPWLGTLAFWENPPCQVQRALLIHFFI